MPASSPSPKQPSPQKPQTPMSVTQKSPDKSLQDVTMVEETKAALQTLQAEYDTFKKEKDENAR